MALYSGNRGIGTVNYGRRVVSSIWRGMLLVWTAVRSCFGSGTWHGEKPWLNQENWKDE